MTLRKGILIAVALTAVVLTFLLWHSKPLRRYLMGTTMDVQEVNFYGRIVDQNDQPVEGAVIPFELAGSALSGSNGAGRVVSDANGNFAITKLKASALLLKTITHPDIEFGYPIPENTHTIWSDSKIEKMGIHGFQPSEGANKVLWSDTSPEKPYVFKAWRISEEPEQIAKNLKFGKAMPSFEYEKTYTLDFMKPRREISKQGDNEAQLRVIFHREADAEDVTQRWEARIIPVDGGIQVTKDPYMNIAPESGYEPEIHVVRKKTGYDSIDNLSNQQYYIKANNGKIYGSLFVAFHAKAYGKMMLDINFKLNPDGERILVKAPSPD